MTFNLELRICYFEFEILIKIKFSHEKFAFYKALQMQIFHIH